VDKAILCEVHQRRKNLEIVWIDYCKAYDSVPHSWIEYCLKTFGVAANICTFMIKAMELWHTQLICGGQYLGTVDIQCGIFQGDSFSPLLFVVCLLPLTMILRKCSSGYLLGEDHILVNHLLYLDDLKLYGRNNKEIQSLGTTVQIFSDDICMKFGFDKCASLSIKKGKFQTVVSPYLEGISPLPEGSVYKYLGVLESNVFDTTQMKTMVQQEFLKRSKTVLQTQLNSRNKVKGLNMFAIPVIRYSAALLDWSLTELNQLDIKFRKLLSMSGAHHLKGDVDRLYLPRNLGGRGFLSVLDVVECERRSLSSYLHNTTETLLLSARTILRISVMTTVDDFVAEARQRCLQQWRNKALHGEFLKKVDSGGEFSLSFYWLKYGRLKMQTEAQVVAAQDQALAVRAVQNRIYGLAVPLNCRVCGEVPEYVDHLLSSCTPLAATMYMQRHDRIGKIIHWSILKRFNSVVSHNYWDHVPAAVVENNDMKVLWDFNIYTDHLLAARCPDIVVIDKQQKTVQIVDVSVPSDCHVAQKEKEKIEKYRDLSIELSSLWRMKCEVIPLVVGGLGCVTTMLECYLQKLAIIQFCSLELLQRTAVLGSSFILRRYL